MGVLLAGDQFALFESVAALAVLLRRFEFRMAPDAPAVGMTTVRLSMGITSAAAPCAVLRCYA